MDKAEQRALEAYPQQDILRTANHYQAERRKEKRRVFREGYRQAEKDLIPLINRLCEAILFDWDNKVELAWEIQSKIKEETK